VRAPPDCKKQGKEEAAAGKLAGRVPRRAVSGPDQGRSSSASLTGRSENQKKAPTHARCCARQGGHT
jgi:hypothetical protein